MKQQEQKKINGSLALKSPCIVVIPANAPEQTRKLRVAAYARVSSNSEDQLNSYAAQNAHYTETIFYKGIMPSEKVLDFPVDCNTLTGSVNL